MKILAIPTSASFGVVLIISPPDIDKGTLGLMINRRSKVPISRIFLDVTGAKADPVYLGGPVELSTAQALVRSPLPSPTTWSTSSAACTSPPARTPSKSPSTAGAEPSKFHLYLGYAPNSRGPARKPKYYRRLVGSSEPRRMKSSTKTRGLCFDAAIAKAESQIAFNARPNGQKCYPHRH